ncbi:hypothetical protein K1719_035847 [Acacia pycnantha]|nr:hypothetical protein K1719_037565 [Acacia pycnantha]KAI9082107.1 hypothetical protein K1719_035847 [Acacia pycnantha]
MVLVSFPRAITPLSATFKLCSFCLHQSSSFTFYFLRLSESFHRRTTLQEVEGKMKNQEQKYITYKKIAWTITNFFSSLLKTNVGHYSEVFILGDCAWRLYICRARTDDKSLVICLEPAYTSSFPKGWSILANFSITVINQVTRKKSRTKDVESRKFIANWYGHAKFMPLSEFEDANSGYVLNDKCIVEVELFSVTFEGIEPTYPSLSKQPSDVHSKDDDVVDFKDMGKIEKALVPMLEDVCSRHPSLMDGNKKRSRKFTEWAFTSLGQVLHFLVNKKWKDMNEEACEQLEALWEELEMSRLDLSWLEPHVKSALNMKGYMEKAMKVKRLKQDLVVLGMEMNKIKENLGSTELMVEMTTKDLIKEQEGFEELDLDLDAEVGYGKP